VQVTLSDGTTVSEAPPWPVDDKIVAAALGPYLAALDQRQGSPTAD